MSDLSLTVLPESPKDAQAIERLHERTFGPGRFVLSAYRLREHVDHLLELSFTARIGTLLVGSVRQLPICVRDTPALVLGPFAGEAPADLHRRHARIDAWAVDGGAAVSQPRRRPRAARPCAGGCEEGRTSS